MVKQWLDVHVSRYETSFVFVKYRLPALPDFSLGFGQRVAKPALEISLDEAGVPPLNVRFVARAGKTG
ncbi:MAG: hypothetical protein ACM3X0_07820 [Bacteroidota bacterium]